VNLEQTKAFLKALQCKNIQPKPDGKWLRCSCPLAPWTHQNHKDSHPSFAITVSEHEEPMFNCFTCMHGSGASLLQTLEMYWHSAPKVFGLPDGIHKARGILDGAKLIPYELPGYEFQTGEHKVFVPWPEVYLQSFSKVEHVPLAKEYLHCDRLHTNMFGQQCRDFTPDAIKAFDLRYDHAKGMVVFPYRDGYGRLAGMRGRSIAKKGHYDYTFNGVNNASLVWFNEVALDLPGWVVVVEGQMDVMRVAMCWPKVVGNLTAKPSAFKLGNLINNAVGTILIPDTDKAGQDSIEAYKLFHMKHNHPFRVLHLPSVVKDADDCSPAYLFDRISELVYL
jgi:hypothetical protein